MDQSLNIVIQDRKPLAIVQLKGSLAQLEVYKFKARMEKLIADGLRFVILDIKKLTFIDSSGIGALVHVRNALQKGNGALVMVGPCTQYVSATLKGSQVGKVIAALENMAGAEQYLAQKFGFKTRTEIEEIAGGQVLAALNQIMNKLGTIEARLKSLEKQQENMF